MQCTVTEQGNATVVGLSGDVDLSTSPRARKAILESLPKAQALLVDLSGVSYIDSSGVASLVEGYQQAKSRGIRFALVGVSSAARSVLELARLDKVFPIYASPAEFLGDGG